MKWIPALVAHTVLAAPIAGQTSTMDTLSLYRLPGVYVEVDLVSEEAAQDGFNRDSVRALIIQKLDDALASQQQQILDLQMQLRYLSSQVKLVENQLPDTPESPPPHY